MNLLGTVLQIIILVVLQQSYGHAATPDAGDRQQLIMQAEAIPQMIKDKVLTKFQIPNPHWQKDACQACHVGEPDEVKSPLKMPSDDNCYFCHSEEDHVSVHPASLIVENEMLKRMSNGFRNKLDKDNKTNCITCHNILNQCSRKNTLSRQRNKTFIRGGDYNSKTSICYQCHNKAAYQKLNPHDQINEQGVVNKDICLTCHSTVPEQDITGISTDLVMQFDFNWSELCLNCHKWRPHPGGDMALFSRKGTIDHLVVPSSKVLKQLGSLAKNNNLELPLEPSSGKVYCATCHNPHERGVIKKASLAKGADEKNRLRSKKICRDCHNK